MVSPEQTTAARGNTIIHRREVVATRRGSIKIAFMFLDRGNRNRQGSRHCDRLSLEVDSLHGYLIPDGQFKAGRVPQERRLYSKQGTGTPCPYGNLARTIPL